MSPIFYIAVHVPGHSECEHLQNVLAITLALARPKQICFSKSNEKSVVLSPKTDF